MIQMGEADEESDPADEFGIGRDAAMMVSINIDSFLRHDVLFL